MNTDEKLNEIFSIYSKVALLSEKNGCRVMRIRHKELGRDLVMHVFPPESNVSAYEKLCKLRFEHLPTVYDVFKLDDGTVVLEEYIDGMTVYEISEAEKISGKNAAKIARDICLALCVLHRENIIHRDVKPENVMVDSHGVTKLIDFNAAHSVSEKTQDTVIMGTVGYAAPEQFGIAQSDNRTDIYALGVLLNVMVTGVHPAEQLARGYIGHIIKKCTNTTPSKRYQSALKLYNALCFV